VRRRKKVKGLEFASTKVAAAREIAAVRRESEKQIARIRRKHKAREVTFKTAISSYRPLKADRGKIVFITSKRLKNGKLQWKASPNRTSKKGFGVYVTRNGTKNAIKSYQSRVGEVERYPLAKRIERLDVSRVKSKKAKRVFYDRQIHAVASGDIKFRKNSLPTGGTLYEGKIKTDRIDIWSKTVEKLAKVLFEAARLNRHRLNFLVSVGIHIKSPTSNRSKFIEINKAFGRRHNQHTTIEECKKFFGLVIYAEAAQILEEAGQVLAGSAAHISRLSDNKGKKRRYWKKDGEEWLGRFSTDVELLAVEYRIDHRDIGK
jgi:hypothetical protein